MKANVEPNTAEIRVVRKYSKLYAALTDFVEALQDMDEGSVVLEDIVVNQKPHGGIRLEYASRPIQLTINASNKQFRLQVVNTDTNAAKSR
jgi:hypothetical protein